ncbi:unnamed protein product [Polarella glacialis]|uniref:OsmC-like protein n=1 Tax=Polarella glacialis TaxID=89957 RepID=A0A813FW75_POLGL|nr:unnamed protein product [Polarella glacialis]CAE8614653.1 unnamed protein product [Polarella glacialis]
MPMAAAALRAASRWQLRSCHVPFWKSAKPFLSAAFATSSEKAEQPKIKSYQVIGEGQGAASEAKCRSHTMRTDVPRESGGKDSAPQPVELVLTALIGCETATAAYVARQMRPRFRLQRIEFEPPARF